MNRVICVIGDIDMALRDQPYIPLYIQDFMTDEKLRECNAESAGVFIFLMCVMHKSEEYGTILLKQTDKQTDDQIKNFAIKLNKHLPYSEMVIERALINLIDNGVIHLDGDKLLQKRMIADNELSNKRAKAGKKGGEISQFGKAFAQANIEAASENEYENENEDLGKESIERGTHSKLKKQKIPIETKLQKYIFDNLPNVSMLKKQLTKAESENLTANFDKDLIIKTLKAMENKVDLTKKYASVNLTLQNWMNRDKPEPEQERQSGLTADDILRKNLSTEAYEKLRSQNA